MTRSTRGRMVKTSGYGVSSCGFEFTPGLSEVRIFPVAIFIYMFIKSIYIK